MGLATACLIAGCDDGGMSGKGGAEPPIAEREDVATWKGNPVDEFGQLQVDGAALRSEDGRLVQLKGASSMWLNWEGTGYAESVEALKYLRDKWHMSVIRAAMGVEPSGAYLSDPEKAEMQVDQVVQNAVELGLYVIIDWHDHTALDHQDKAEAFFEKMAEKYGDLPNVLYETFNEPKQVSWANQLKPYHEAVLQKIRAKDEDNIVILGTPNWSQDVDAAAQFPVEGKNLMYTLHFYACTHQGSFMAKGQSALRMGAALFVTEWGATPSDGGVPPDNDIVCVEPSDQWHDFMNDNAISWTAWKLDDCADSSCYFKAGTPVDGPFTDDTLQGHGSYVRDKMKQ